MTTFNLRTDQIRVLEDIVEGRNVAWSVARELLYHGYIKPVPRIHRARMWDVDYCLTSRGRRAYSHYRELGQIKADDHE